MPHPTTPHPGVAPLCALIIALGACGDATSGGPDSTPNGQLDGSGEQTSRPELPEEQLGALCPAAAQDGLTVSGSVYLDQNDSANTLYDQGVDPEDAPPPTPVSVSLFTTEKISSGLTCDGGEFAFEGLEPGRYLIDVAPEASWSCASTNCGRNLATAIRGGQVNVVAFGDSVPAYGPEPWFPERFGAHLSGFAEVTVTNVAIPGSESREWLPGTRAWVNRLAPTLDDADVIVFSLGGNDLYSVIDDINSPDAQAILGQVDAILELIDQIKANLKAIVEAIRAEAPHADIVWLLYPNYAMSRAWGEIAGDYQGAAELLLETELKQIREEMADVPGLLIMDIFAAVDKARIDTLLLDELHLNAEGHAFYAEELFRTLGGVHVTADAPHVTRDFGFRP